MLVSVYLPTRNRVESLNRAIDSVLSQTYVNFELIVVNDGSTDGTEEYLQQKTGTDPRVHWHSNKHALGAPTSRNIAIKCAKGVFVTGLDDDDEFLPERLSAFVDYWSLLTSKGIQPACIYAQDIWLSNGKLKRYTQKKSSISESELLDYNYIGNQIFAPREHFVGAGLFDELLPAWQDLEFFMRVLGRFGKAHLLDMPTYLFDVTPRSNNISAQQDRIRAAFEIVAEKHTSGERAKTKALFLQMFQDEYNISPTTADWYKFIRFGNFPMGFLRMLRATTIIRGSR